jgi:hypothetical protein
MALLSIGSERQLWVDSDLRREPLARSRPFAGTPMGTSTRFFGIRARWAQEMTKTDTRQHLSRLISKQSQ